MRHPVQGVLERCGRRLTLRYLLAAASVAVTFLAGPYFQFPIAFVPVAMAAWFDGLAHAATFAGALPVSRFAFVLGLWTVPWKEGHSLANAMRHGLTLSGCFLLTACTSPSSAPTIVTLVEGRCVFSGAGAPGSREAALCAEAFVVRQVYTTAAVTDTSGLRGEFIEPGKNWADILAHRHGMLPSIASWVCPLDVGFLVIFPYLASHPYAAPRILVKGLGPNAPIDTVRGPWARAVRLTADLAEVEMRHSEFADSASAWRRGGCVDRAGLR